MIPYGIIIKENGLALQQSYVIWQKKFGLLKPGTFFKISLPVLTFFTVLSVALQAASEKEAGVSSILFTFIAVLFFTVLYLYLAAMKTVKQYGENISERKIQLLLKENEIEIMTEFSKDSIPYDEIDYCFEKDFLVTLIYDRYNFPISISKVNVEKGNYDVFVSLLQSRIPGRYEKKGEN